MCIIECIETEHGVILKKYVCSDECMFTIGKNPKSQVVHYGQFWRFCLKSDIKFGLYLQYFHSDSKTFQHSNKKTVGYLAGPSEALKFWYGR